MYDIYCYTEGCNNSNDGPSKVSISITVLLETPKGNIDTDSIKLTFRHCSLACALLFLEKNKTSSAILGNLEGIAVLSGINVRTNFLKMLYERSVRILPHVELTMYVPTRGEIGGSYANLTFPFSSPEKAIRFIRETCL